MNGYFLAEVKAFAGNFAPRNWIECEGQLLPIAQNTALFSLIGTIYGGDGRTTFGIPDLRGRAPVGATNTMGNGPGLSPVHQGSKLGAETVTLNITELPSHNHGSEGHIAFSSNTADKNTAAGNYWALDGIQIYSTATVADAQMAADSVVIDSVSNTGGNLSHQNMNPSLVMIYILCTNGPFPSRS